MNRKSEETKEKQISEVMASIENRVRHAYNQGYEQGLKDSKQEPKTGHWEENETIRITYCSECGFGKRIDEYRVYNYCPICGARMESEGKE